MIKANAYGHGAVIAADALKNEADCYMVAELGEALQLREQGIDLPILIAGYTSPQYADLLCEMKLTQCVYSTEYALALNEALSQNSRLKIHIKVDTGMHRLGLDCKDKEILEEISAIRALPRLYCEGIFSHFAQSEEEDDGFTKLQEERFDKLLTALSLRGIRFDIRHVSNSASSMLGIPAFCNGVRIGLSLYGVYPSEPVRACWLKRHPESGLLPVMELKTRVAQIRELTKGEALGYNLRYTAPKPTRIAVLTAGYGDGLSRHLTLREGAPVITAEDRLVGSVCMDMCFAELNSDRELSVGDEVTLFGSDEISADDWAEHCRTISYEIFCRITERVPRVKVEK